MSGISTLILLVMMLWLLVSLLRGLAFDLLGFGSEPKLRWGGERASGSSEKLRQSRLYISYPLMAACVAGLGWMMFAR